MKVMLVISALGSGGAERVMSDMANYWASCGITVQLVTFSSADVKDFFPLDSRVRRLHLSRRRTTRGPLDKIKFNISRLSLLRQVVQQERPDAVLSFMDSTNVLTILACTGLNIPVVVSVRNDPVKRQLPFAWHYARRWIYRHAQHVVAQSSAVADWLRKECRANVTVIPNPLRQLPAIAHERERLILAVGRLIPEKGHDVLLQAFSNLAHDYPDWNLAILGDGPLRQQLSEQRATLGLEGRVEMPGNVGNVEEWLARASIFVQSSRSEGFPNALLEAIGMGTAAISTDCAHGPSELIESGRNGLLVPVDDVPAMAAAIGKLICNESLRISYGKAAKFTSTQFSQRSVMSMWECLLNIK